MVKAFGEGPAEALNRPPGRLLGPLFAAPPKAPYATLPQTSRGRLFPEPESATRICYQRDRDRLIHSTAFRRLKHKTQVFVQHEGDYYRTRLTHSLEVAQIARAIARQLGIDEDLAEALALSHDFGHPPFGHAGEDALDACMQNYGGFDHNAQALALVTRLEHRYPHFDGLNLTWETLEGLVKHNGPLITESRSASDLPEAITRFEWDLELSSHAGLEAQVAALADDIAYVNHDIDDGLRAGLFAFEELVEVPLAGPLMRAAVAELHGVDVNRAIAEGVRRLIGVMVGDVVAETRARLDKYRPENVSQLRALPVPMAAFSQVLLREVPILKAFLYRRMYRHDHVMTIMGQAQNLLTELFGAYITNPQLLPADWQDACAGVGDTRTARAVCDYIAGMTDGFAQQEYKRVFHMEFPLHGLKPVLLP